MKPSHIISIAAASLSLILGLDSAHAAKGGKKGGPDGAGPNDSVYTIESLDPYIPQVDSHSVDSDGQIVYYGAMDLSGFVGSDSSGACDHGFNDGIIVVYPQSRKNPLAAELIFWFEGILESGDAVTHLLTMQGQFDEPDNWPPSAGDPETTITLNYWEFAAENRKAQRQDCAGESDFPAGPWTVTVTLKP